MKINNKKTNSSTSRSRVIPVFLAVIIIALLTLFCLEKMKITDFIKLPQDNTEIKQQEAAKKYDEQKKQEFIEQKTIPSTSPTEASVDSSSIEINASQSGSSVTILTKLSAISSGLCALSIANGEKSFTDTAQVIYQPEFSSCAGFSIATSQLGPGIWDITLNVTHDSDKTITKTTRINVK